MENQIGGFVYSGVRAPIETSRILVRACQSAEGGQEEQRIGELERMVGRLTLELEVAKKASSILTSASGRSVR